MLALLNKSKRAKSVESGMLIVELIITHWMIDLVSGYVTTGLSQLGQESRLVIRRCTDCYHTRHWTPSLTFTTPGDSNRHN